MPNLRRLMQCRNALSLSSATKPGSAQPVFFMNSLRSARIASAAVILQVISGCSSPVTVSMRVTGQITNRGTLVRSSSIWQVASRKTPLSLAQEYSTTLRGAPIKFELKKSRYLYIYPQGMLALLTPEVIPEQSFRYKVGDNHTERLELLGRLSQAPGLSKTYPCIETRTVSPLGFRIDPPIEDCLNLALQIGSNGSIRPVTMKFLRQNGVIVQSITFTVTGR